MTRWEREGWGHSGRRSGSSEKHEAWIGSELKDGSIPSCNKIKMSEKMKEPCWILEHAWPGFKPTLHSGCYFFLSIKACGRCNAKKKKKKMRIIQFSIQAKSWARLESCDDLKRCGRHIWSICCKHRSNLLQLWFQPHLQEGQLMSGFNTHQYQLWYYMWA